jgi:hypothetical protein
MCQHDPSAIRDNLCCDCIIEQLYHHEIISIKTIMTAGALNLWRKPEVLFGLIVYYSYRLLGIKEYRYSPKEVPVLSMASA